MKIIFTPSSLDAELFVEPPLPAKKLLPEWYKDIPVFNAKNPKFENNELTNKTLKMCMPFFDASTGGYIQRTWTDIHIGLKDNVVSYNCASSPAIMGAREKVSPKISNIYYPVEFVWQRQWTAKLPKGYSLLITHPHNRLDLPFQTMSGIVDSDVFYHSSVGNIPFFIHNGFEGFIPSGTPMFQMIPVKRNNWESEIQEFNEKEILKLDRIMKSKFYGAYRNMFWHKKNYI